MLAEVREPADLVYGTPEVTRPVAYATYADELNARMRQAYTLVRKNLGVAAKRTSEHMTSGCTLRPIR